MPLRLNTATRLRSFTISPMSYAIRVLIAATAVFLCLMLILVVRAYWPRPSSPAASPALFEHDDEGIVNHLAEALRFKTISYRDAKAFDRHAFHRFHRWLVATYPNFHRTASRESFGLSLLYTWRGSDQALSPVLLMAHQDVVPIEPGTAPDWIYPPFAGKVADGYVWGRGTMDMKSSLVGLFEAVEGLLAQGYRPERTLLFAFGHDEEVGGFGNREIAEALKKRGARLHWILDEGLAVVDGLLPGAKRPIALIGVAEKGYLTLELRTTGPGGHSSMPPPHTVLGTLARALSRLEARPFPATLDGPVAAMLGQIAPAMPFWQRMAFANLWLFEPLVVARLEESAPTNALVRTTTAPTMIEGGIKENVLPQHARAVVNFRIHPRDSTVSVIEGAIAAIDNPEVRVLASEESPVTEPSPISRIESSGYGAVAGAIRAAFPTTAVAPGLSLVATDSRHYQDLADDTYRFTPNWLKPGDPERIHGTNERISIENFKHAVRFYTEVIRRAGQ